MSTPKPACNNSNPNAIPADRRATCDECGDCSSSCNSAAPVRPANGVLDRRMGVDRRDLAAFNDKQGGGAAGADDFTGLERRRGVGRRRSDFMKSAEEGEMTSEQFHFLSAVEAFKKANNKMFPTWTDVLEVVRLLGYRKTMPSELNLRNVEDWKEKPDAPHGVRVKPGHPEERRMAA